MQKACGQFPRPHAALSALPGVKRRVGALCHIKIQLADQLKRRVHRQDRNAHIERLNIAVGDIHRDRAAAALIDLAAVSYTHLSEAIRCSLPVIGTVGYIANAPNTVAGGTMSAGRIYDHVKKRFYVRVMFTTFTKIICRIEFGNPQGYEAEIKARMDGGWNADLWEGD